MEKSSWCLTQYSFLLIAEILGFFHHFFSVGCLLVRIILFPMFMQGIIEAKNFVPMTLWIVLLIAIIEHSTRIYEESVEIERSSYLSCNSLEFPIISPIIHECTIKEYTMFFYEETCYPGCSRYIGIELFKISVIIIAIYLSESWDIFCGQCYPNSRLKLSGESVVLIFCNTFNI